MRKPLERFITHKINEAPPIRGSKWFAHLPIRGGGGFTEFDVEFKFAKIQNSYV